MSILGGSLHAIDHQDSDRSLIGHDLQPKLFLQRGEDRRARGVKLSWVSGFRRPTLP